MKVADTTTLLEETATAFAEVLALEAEIERLTAEIALREDYESEEYAALLQRLNEANDHYHILGGETRDADIEKTLLGLGFRREDFARPTSEFSGGWRMRIELAKLLLRRPSVFLLDEPTNHLDIESIQWLEEYLKNYSGAVLVISHDRAFLDNVTNRTIELSLGKIYDYKLPYSKFVVARAERRAQQLAAYQNQQRLIEKSEEFIGNQNITGILDTISMILHRLRSILTKNHFRRTHNRVHGGSDFMGHIGKEHRLSLVRFFRLFF